MPSIGFSSFGPGPTACVCQAPALVHDKAMTVFSAAAGPVPEYGAMLKRLRPKGHSILQELVGDIGCWLSALVSCSRESLCVAFGVSLCVTLRTPSLCLRF